MENLINFLTRPQPMSTVEILLMCMVFALAFLMGAKAVKTAKKRLLKDKIQKGMHDLIKQEREKNPHLRYRGIKRRARRVLREDFIKNGEKILAK